MVMWNFIGQKILFMDWVMMVLGQGGLVEGMECSSWLTGKVEFACSRMDGEAAGVCTGIGASLVFREVRWRFS